MVIAVYQESIFILPMPNYSHWQRRTNLCAPLLQNDSPPPPSRRLLGGLLAFSLIWLVPVLACGSFQPRPTPTPPPVVSESTQPAAIVSAPLPTDTPAIVIEPTPEPTPELLPTDTPVPVQGGTLTVGTKARVSAPGGLNLRQTANTNAQLITRLGSGLVVDVLEGPTAGEGYIWWRIDDGKGNVGWAVQGDGGDEWLSPAATTGVVATQPVNRAPRVGDRVRVTMDNNGQLSLRTTPGTNAQLVTRVNSGAEFTVLAGPQSVNGFIWFQIRSDDGQTQGWAADGNNSIRWLSPLE